MKIKAIVHFEDWEDDFEVIEFNSEEEFKAFRRGFSKATEAYRGDGAGIMTLDDLKEYDSSTWESDKARAAMIRKHLT